MSYRSVSSRHEIVFILGNLSDIQRLVEGVNPGTEVYILDPRQDGLAQMADILAGRSGIDAIHLLSHGSIGELQLGTATLKSSTVNDYAGVLSQISSALSPAGDLLLYGCNVAAGSEGQLLIDTLARLTQADVAASDDLTGAAALGGDWVLEYQTGTIESALPFADGVVVGYGGVLTVPTITDPADLSASEDVAKSLNAVLSVTAPESTTMEAVVSVISGEGVLSNGSVSLSTLAVQGDRSNINTFFNSLSFIPTGDWVGTATIQVTVETDYGTRNDGDITTFDVNITVNPVNDAPVFNASYSPTLTGISEDILDGSNTGTLVSALVVDGSITDVDGTVLESVYVTAVDNAHGTWQYRVGAGSWTPFDFGNNSGKGLLLSATDSVRFVPAANWKGSATITFGAWDGTSGAGTYADISAKGNATPFSTATDTASITVSPVNDTPTTVAASLSVDKNSTLTFSLSSSDNDTGTNSTTDAVVTKYTIVSLSGINGTLTKNGGATVAEGNELTVAEATNMTFTPTNNYIGSATFTFQAIDAAGATSNPSTATIAVQSVNMAPAISVPVGLQTLQTINEESTLTLDNILLSDVDAGLARVKVEVVATYGTVTLSKLGNLYDAATAGNVLTNATGASLTLYGTFSDINAALDNLLYTPSTNYFGAASVVITVDDLGNTGGALKTDSETISLIITNVPDDPQTGAAALAAITEDTLDPNGATIASLLTNFSDVDINTLAGIAISANTADAAHGVWQYSLNNGATWNDVGTVDSATALLLSASTLLRFAPAANYYGTDGLTIHAIDSSTSRNFTTDQNSRRTADVAAEATDLDGTGNTLTTSVTSVNDVFTVVSPSTAKLLVNEGNAVGGSSALLTSQILQITDVEADATHIVYTLQASGTVLGDGVFQKNTGTNEIQTWVNLAADGTFTQADIDASHVRYVHSGAEPLGTEVLSYSVTDSVEGGGGTTEIRTLTLKVSPVNDVPVLYLPGETVPGETPVALTATVPVRGILTFDTSTHTGNHIVVVDSDNTDEQLVFRIESLPTQGYLSYNGKEIGLGSVFNYDNLDLLTYTHTGNIDGIDSFKVTLRDGAGGVVGVDPNKTVTIAVGGQNFAPIWIGNLYGTIWEDPTSYGASANNDGKKLADYAGFDFRDQNSGASVDGYAIVGNTALSGSQGVWQYKTGTNEWSNIGTVTDDGNALVIGADTLVRFSPVSNYNGTPPSLQVRVLDNTYSGSFSASGTTESRVPLDTTNDGGTTPISSTINSLTIAVRAVNDDPYLVHNDGLSLSATSPQMVTITSVMLSVDDIDTLADNNLVYRVTNRIDNGFLLLNDSALGEGGTFTQADITAGNVRYYLPLGSYATNPTFDSFQFQVRDGAYHAVLDCVGGIYSGETLQTLTFNISLNNPITATTYTGQGGTGSSGSSTDARDDYFYTNRNTAITIAESSVVANDSWYSTYTIVAGSSTNGSVSYNADTDQFTFTQTTGFVGTATFNYTLTNQENSSDTATVTVYVLLVNADPTLSVNQSLTSNEGDVATIGNTLLKVDDTDNSADQIRITLTSLPSNGWLYRDTGGNATTLGGSAYLLRAGDTLTQADINAGYLKFDHDGTDDFSSTVAFTYTDGGGGTIGSGTFNLDITPVNDQPELFVDDFKLNEGASYNLQPLIISQDIDGLVDTNYDGIYGNTGDTASDKTTGLAAVNTLTYRISDLPDNGQIRLVDESETYNANDAGTYMVLTTGSIIEKAWVDNNRLYYWHNNSETSSDSFVVELNDNTAQANSTVSATIHVTVLALNDDPVVIKNTSVSGAITYNTSGVTHNPAPDAYSKTSFSLYAGVTKVLDEAFLLGSDPDSSDTQLQFRIVDKPDYGDLLLNSTQVLGVGSRVTQADIVAGNLSYRHDGSETTVDSFVFTLSDGGGGLEPTGTFSITIQPVNDVPTITLPTARTAIEDLPLAISGVSIADVDALSTDALTVTLAATNGVLSLIIDNLTFSTGDGAADATMTFSGTLTNINAALATLSYQGNSNYNGADSITVVVNDGGHNGIDPDTITERTDDNGNTEYQSATATLAINVRSVNDAPEAHVLAATQSVNEDTALVFSSAHSNLLSISDVDAGTNPVSVTVSVTQGTFTLGETSGLSISTGDGSGDATMTFTGTVADINAALAGLSYQGALNYHGAETLTLTVNDQRNTGDLGTAGSDTKTVAITVNPINDNPIATDMSFSGAEDASFIAVALASADVDDGVHGSTSTDAEVNRYCIDTLPSNGTLEYNNGSGWVSVTANQELTKAQGENLRFVPNAHFNSSLLAGNPTFTFIALDAAGAVSATRTATITVTAVNDAPELSGGGDTVTYNEGSGVTGQGMAVVLDANADLAVTDREITETGYITDDFNGATLTVQRSGGAATDDRYGINTSGSVTLSGTNVIYNSSTIGTITNNSATGILVVTFNATAPKAGVDAVMCNVTFSSVDDNLAGSITVAMVFNDGNAGEQGSGGAKSSAAQTFTVTVGNINDQPYFTGNGSITLAEDSDGGTATGNNAGSSVTTIMGSLFADPDSGLAGSTFAGVAIFGDVANRTTQGYWQYSTNGITWYDVSPEVGPALSETNALILSAASTLRFVPVPNFNSVPSGNPGALSVMAIDNSNTGGRTYTAGETRALLSTTTVSGADSDIGTLEASRKTIVATVTQVNDAPSIVNLAGVAGSFLEFSEAVGVNLAGQAVRLDSLDDSDTEGIQNTLATIVDIDITQRVEDTFNGARLVIGEQTTLDTNDLYVLQTGSGVAVTGGYTEPGSGLILFNSGSAVLYNNVFVATITDNSAASGQLVITFNANATSAAVNAVLQNIVYSNDNDKLISENKNIEVKFYDGNTNSAQGTGGELSNTIIIAIHLTSTNDAPLLSAGATISTTEDPVTTTETTIGALLFGNFSDPDTVSGNALGGVALSAYNTQGLGNWWIKIGSGEWTNLSTIAPISATNALLLSADTQVKFVQNLNANTQGATRPSLTVYAVENLAPADATHTGAGAAAEPISFTTVIGSPVFYTKLSTDTLEARVSAASKNVDVAIAAVNDAPTIAGTIGTSGSISVTESNTASSGTDPVQLISSVSVGDPDLITTATLADNTFGGGSITVSLTGGVTGDQLTVSTLGGVMSQSGGADGATLTVNLTASATTAQVNAILEAIRFQHTKDTPPITARAFTITLYDNSNTDAQNDTAGTGGSQPASISGTITITEQNDPPVGTATTVTVNEDTTYTFTAANFGYTQPGDETDTLLAVRIDTLPTNGTLWFDADGDGTNDDTAISTSQVISKTDIDSGKLRFTPVAQANGAAYTTFTFSVQDSRSAFDTSSKTMTVTVTAVNDAPTISDLDPTSSDTPYANPYVQGGSHVIIDHTATFFDQELATERNNWNGATLTISRQTTVSTDDIFSNAYNLGSIGAASGNVVLSSTTVGTYTQTGGVLRITFNNSATTALVNETLQSITYRNAITIPGGLSYNSVTLDVTINDQNNNVTGGGTAGTGQDQGNGGLQLATGSIVINIDRLPIANLDGQAVSEGVTTTSVSTTNGDITPENSNAWDYKDTDQDGDTLTVQGIAKGNVAGVVQTSGVASDVTGNYGKVNVSADGSYTYTLENTNEAVQALAIGKMLTDIFTYTINDGRGGTASTLLMVNINGTNDAPILIDTPLAVIQTEDSAVPSGAVGTLVSSLASSSNISDLDTNLANPKGIAITATDSNRGIWYYSINGGTNWSSFTATDSTARLLLADANTLVYFKPTADWHGSVISALTLRAWDGSSGSNGGTANVTSIGTGGTTAFSIATDVVDLTVTSVNDRPTPTSNVMLSVFTEDVFTPVGSTISELAFGYSDATDDQNNSNTASLIGGDTSSAFTYLAVVGSANYVAAQGTWQISNTPSPDANTTSHWIDITKTVADTLSTSNALIFNATSQVRFVPAGNFHGTPGTLTVRLADANVVLTASTSASDYKNLNDTANGDLDLSSGSWSDDNRTLGTTVDNVNDRPTATATTLAATAENTAEPAGALVSTLGFGYSDATDNQLSITGGLDGKTAFGGIAIVGNAADATAQGEWQYNKGSGWVAIGSGVSVPTDETALILPTTASLRFVPKGESNSDGNFDFNGTPGVLTVRVADTAQSFSASSNISATVNDQTSIWSTTTTLTTSVTAVNDAPTVTLVTTSTNTFIEGTDTASDRSVLGTPIVLDANVHIADVDIITRGEDTFASTTLTIARNDAGTGFSANSDDVFGIATDPTITIATNVISYSGTPVADVTTNSGGQLLITFRAAATSTMVDAVIGAITYANSSDTPTENVSLRYRFNDDNQSSAQGSGNSLTGDDVITVNLTAQNDMPLAVDDEHQIAENAVSISGNVKSGTGSPNTTADSDPESNILTVSAIRLGTEGGSGIAGTVDGSTVLNGSYGTLVIASDGSYTYALNNSNTDVNKLKTGLSLTDVFTYTISDNGAGTLTDTAQLTITINGTTDGAPTITAVDGNDTATGQATVTEAGLEDDGSTAETVTGTVTITALDGLTSISVGGTTVIRAALLALGSTNVVIDTGEGTLTLNGYTSSTDVGGITTGGTLSYSYTLKVRLTHSDTTESTDVIALAITDEGNATTNSTTLVIRIVDDVPTAHADARSVIEGTVGSEAANVTGNVVTAGVADEVADRLGADVPANPVTAVIHGTATTTTAITAGSTSSSSGTVVAGLYGSLTIGADGSYSYDLDDANADVNALKTGVSLADTFTYKITDADGDTSTATLTITINGTTDNAPTITAVDGNNSDAGHVTVQEAGLTDVGVTSETTTDTITLTAPDGLATVTIGGVTFTVAQLAGFNTTPSTGIDTGEGTLKITEFTGTTGAASAPTAGTVHYSYTLKARLAHTGDTAIESTDPIAISITDKGNATISGSDLVIRIVDDVPTANADAHSVAEGTTTAATSTSGNVVSGTTNGDVADRIGADTTATPLTAISFGGNTKTVGQAFESTYGSLTINSNGSYTYSVNNANADVTALNASQTLTETFVYTITDADGDSQSANLVITITGINDAPTITAGLTTATDSFTETADTTGSSTTHTLNGSIAFADVEVADTHTTSVTSRNYVWSGGTLSAAQQIALASAFTLGAKTDSNGSGTQAWQFSSADSTVDFLAAGQTLTATYSVTVTDSSGAANNSCTQNVVVTITGTNDVPTITLGTGDSDVAALTETDAKLTASDTLTIGDVDYTNTVTAAVHSLSTTGDINAVENATLLGLLTVSPINIISTTETSDSLTWTFDSGTHFFDYLEKNETLTLAYTVRVTDSNSPTAATADQIVTITITGSNDNPTLSIASPSSVEELANASTQDPSAITGNLGKRRLKPVESRECKSLI